jgi:hypothetical protein
MSAANVWVTMMGMLRGVGPLESTRHAKLCLRSTLDEIEETEQSMNEQLAGYIAKIKAAKQGGGLERMDMTRIKAMLMQCKKIRMKLLTLSKKKLALENHMDTLDNSELNQHVLYSMQKTSHALKGMGLDKALESVDRVMMDLEENHGDVTSIQNSLASSFDANDDFDWEAEMEMLLAEDMYVGPNPKKTEVSAPVTSNAIALDTVPPGAQEAQNASRISVRDAETELAVMA